MAWRTFRGQPITIRQAAWMGLFQQEQGALQLVGRVTHGGQHVLYPWGGWTGQASSALSEESQGTLNESPRTLASTCFIPQKEHGKEVNLFPMVSYSTQHTWPPSITQFWPRSSSALVRSSTPICRQTLLGILSQEYGSSVPQRLILPCSPPPPPPHIEFRG